VLHVRRNIRNARSPSVIVMTIATRSGRRGSRASPPMRIRRLSRRGAAMSPAPRSTGATCWGRPHRRRPVALKCRHRAGRERRGTTRLWARAHVRRLPLSEWASGLSAPVRRPAGRALPSCKDLRPVKPILREGRRSDRCPSASSMTARTAPTPTPCRSAGRGGGGRIRHRRRVRRRQWNRVLPHDACNRFLSGVAEPRMFTCPLSQAGATVQLRPLRKPEEQPLS
jgi:hypothetical protein